jgi:hypothetical protein
MSVTSILAYLDPGSGSAILQVLAGGLAAVGVTMKLFWRRILISLHIRKEESGPTQGSDATASKSDTR